MECRPGNGPKGKITGKGPGEKRFRVCVTSVRSRLCDTDNIVAKWTVDCIRRGGIIPDDDPETAVIEVSQRQVKPGEAEHSLVEVYEL